MSKQLRPYQTEGINQLAYKSTLGMRKLIFQLPTGGGKTVCFAGLVQRYLAKKNKKVLIVVHREELLKQARRTIFDWYNIIAEPITAGTKHIPDAPIYVAMVETANNRLKKRPNYFGDIGLLIIDEAHLGNFTKLHDRFENSLIIGFTATPISASKKFPLKNIYEDIVCGIDIPDLVANGSLVPNKTYHIKNINRKSLSIKNGEFDDKMMGEVYSRPKQVHNTVDGYTKFCRDTKTIVFNCNVEHSKLVNQAFVDAGYEARHLDGTCTSAYRSECLQWFESTPNAILNNIGILTTGFDSPSVRSVIVNKSTMSLPLWLQMTGRGSRPYPGKDHFTILDLGGNALHHGDWCSSRDWADLFHNPDKPSEGGVAPVKECVHCEAIIHASVRVCPYCQGDVSVEMKIDDKVAEFELLTERMPVRADVGQLIEANTGRKDYAVLHQLKHAIIGQARHQWRVKELTDPVAYKMLELYQGKVAEWCKSTGRPYNSFHKNVPTQWFFDELKKVYGWQPEALNIAV